MIKNMEMNCCGEKKTYRSEQEKNMIANRISRIEGQLKGIRRMVQEDAYCNDVLVQLSAAEHSVKSLANYVLENHLYSCVLKGLEQGNMEVIDELIDLFKKFNKS